MKKIFGLALATIVFATSCKEKFEQPGAFSSFAVVHASPVSATAPTDTLHVFAGDAKYTAAGITYLTTSFGPYLPISSGNYTMNIRRKDNTASDLYVTPFTFDFAPGKAYSFFVYDTTTSATGQAKVLKLQDTLTLPATTPVPQAKFRFLHLAPNQGAVDVTYARYSIVSTTPTLILNPLDSFTITNKTYIGGTPNETALAAFTSVNKGVYKVKIKTAGSTAVLDSTLLLSSAAQINGSDVTQGPIYTFYLSGTAKGRPRAVRSLKHY